MPSSRVASVALASPSSAMPSRERFPHAYVLSLRALPLGSAKIPPHKGCKASKVRWQLSISPFGGDARRRRGIGRVLRHFRGSARALSDPCSRSGTLTKPSRGSSLGGAVDHDGTSNAAHELNAGPAPLSDRRS